MTHCHNNNDINDINEAVVRTLEQYFQDLDGEKPCAIYDMVIKCIEKPMLQFVLDRASGNQSAAAQLLGINRNTLHRKLTDHNLL
ncbi:MAG: Fis family transcriptional regulator [Azoarcus sp.]|jgi:Fis family transcriptional regulator|nr:Fis family transcriptional regulator [Azoarcus sp.]